MIRSSHIYKIEINSKSISSAALAASLGSGDAHEKLGGLVQFLVGGLLEGRARGIFKLQMWRLRHSPPGRLVEAMSADSTLSCSYARK